MAMPMTPEDAPFQQPAPVGDEVPVFELADGTYTTEEPAPESKDEEPDFNENLALKMKESELLEIGSELCEAIARDESARAEWRDRQRKGLLVLAPDGGDPDDKALSDRGLSTVTHPMIVRAATQFEARAIEEMHPANGPVQTVVLGDADEESEARAIRVKDFMNYQVGEQMTEYFPEEERLLFNLPLVGQCYKKVWWDPDMDRLVARYAAAVDVIVPPDTSDMMTAVRVAHRLILTRYEMRRYVESDFYMQPPGDPEQQAQTDVQQVEGKTPSPDTKDSPFEVFEVYTERSLPQECGDDGEWLPYVITVDKASKKAIAIRRNWREHDPARRRRVWLVSYKFLPGLGWEGFGLYHAIGGLARAATGALRYLLDSAAFANLQGGFKLKSRMRGGELTISPGEFKDYEGAIDDINKAIMPFPFKEPSQTLLALLGTLNELGEQFAGTTELNVGEGNNAAPVGTTVAMMENGARVFSAIHKRLHKSKALEYRIMAELNAEHLPDTYPYRIKNASKVIARSDFDERVDVIPVSDPNTFSTTQRISMAQAQLQLSQQFPQYHDQYEALRAMYVALRIPHYEKVLKAPAQPTPMDPVSENMLMTNNVPVKAFDWQEHTAHMVVHDQWFAGLPPQAQQMLFPQYAAHRAEHMAFYYRAQMQAQIQTPLPALSDPSAKGKQFQPVPPQMDAMISQMAAAAVNGKPPQQIGPPLPGQQGQGDDPMKAAMMVAQAEVEALKMKAQTDMQIEMSKHQQRMELEKQKAAADAQRQMAETALKIQQQREEAAAQIRQQMIENQQQMEMNRQQFQQELALQMKEAEAKLRADITAIMLKAEAQAKAAQQKGEAQAEAARRKAAAKPKGEPSGSA